MDFAKGWRPAEGEKSWLTEEKKEEKRFQLKGRLQRPFYYTGVKKTMALAKNIKITKTKDYNSVYSKGKRYRGRYVIMFIKENHRATSRVGIVTSKKVGKAVARNRVKRQLRHILYNKINLFQKNCDIVIVTRYNIAGTDGKQIEKDVMSLAKKGGLC